MNNLNPYQWYNTILEAWRTTLQEDYIGGIFYAPLKNTEDVQAGWSWLGLFSISELFFGDRRKRSLIYRVLTAKNMRPQKVTWLGRKGDLVRFFEYFFGYHRIKNWHSRAQNSSMDFLKWLYIGLQKNQHLGSAKVRYYGGNGLKLTSFCSNWPLLTQNEPKWKT